MPNSIDEIIQRAMQEGQFDNLPGKGKPLQLDDNPYENADWRAAHHILKSSGFTLPWIETLREIETDLDSARLSLQRAWAWKQNTQAAEKDPAWAETEWRQSVERFRGQVASLNKRIADYNLQIPSDRFQRNKINPDKEIQAIQSNA
jgi:DnaJ family protein C protein 28